MILKCISLWQPWATAMAIGLKEIETRDWPCGYRGLMGIHAAKRWGIDQKAFIAQESANLSPEQFGQFLSGTGWQMPFGAVVAVGELADVVRTESIAPHGISVKERAWGNYTPGRWAWRFRDIQRLDKPIVVNGKQGFFNVTVSPEQIAWKDGTL